MEEHLSLPRLVEQLTDHSAMHLPRRVVAMETTLRLSVAAKQAS
jgi:hypothetical protein